MFNGEKHVVLSTSNVIGGRNDTTYVAFFTLGFLLIISGSSIMILDSRKKPKRSILTKPTTESQQKPSRHKKKNYHEFGFENAKDGLEDQVDGDIELPQNSVAEKMFRIEQLNSKKGNKLARLDLREERDSFELGDKTSS